MAKMSGEQRRVLAIENARQRRADRAGQRAAQVEWAVEQLESTVRLSMDKRVRTATTLLMDRVVRNISVPVVKATSRTTRRVFVVERSKPGEFPRADTTQLMKTIFPAFASPQAGVFDGFVGTPLDYGLILETRMDRSFLLRTFNENLNLVTRILSGPIAA